MRSYLICVVIPPKNVDTHILKALETLKFKGKILLFKANSNKRILNAIKELKKKKDVSVRNVSKFRSSIFYNYKMWRIIKENLDYDYVLVIKSTMCGFPKQLLTLTGLPDLMISKKEKPIKIAEFLLAKSYLLDVYEPDIDKPFEKFIQQSTKVTNIVNYRKFYFDEIIKSFPLALYIEVTTRCNLNCSYCVRDERKGDIIDLDVFEGIITKFKKAKGVKVQAINLIGLGEPLLHPQFKEICNIVEKHELMLTFTTNGIIFNKDLYENLPPNVDLYISLDGVNPDGVMKKTRHIDPRIVMNTIKKIRELRPNMRITLQPVIVKGFINEAVDFVKFANTMGCCIHATVPVLPNKKIYEELAPSASEVAGVEVILRLCKSYSPNLSPEPIFKSCLDPFNLLLVLINGDVYPCCFINTIRTQKTEYFGSKLLKIDVPQYILGNIHRDKVEDIIRSDKIYKVREVIGGTHNNDFEYRNDISLKDSINYCRICLARWKQGC